MIARGAVRPADGQASGQTPRTLDERIADDIGVARLFGPFAVDLAGVARRFGCPRDAAEAAAVRRLARSARDRIADQGRVRAPPPP